MSNQRSVFLIATATICILWQIGAVDEEQAYCENENRCLS